MQQAFSKAKKKWLETAKTVRIQNQKPSSNPICVTVGDQVWLKKEKRRKLDPVYSGTFEIVGIIHPNVKIKNTTNLDEQVVHKNRIISLGR